jgi:membrane-bound serine protease (ClpP class)
MNLFYRFAWFFILSSPFTLGTSFAEETNQSSETPAPFDANESKGTPDPALAYVIPIKDQIGSPILDILRRGLKDAIRGEATVVILDMDTPGGELGVTLEIMQEIIESLEKFEGKIITYVNPEAISAGAYIAIATSEIAFSPRSQIGAAEAVSGGGGNIDASMKRKINSYLKAKIRNYAGDYRYRSQVMSAMMDANESLVIEGEPLKAADGSMIKKAGELLTLTGREACQFYGEPPAPLLGFGVYENVEAILDERFGAGNYKVVNMEMNWAEETGLWLNGIAPIILSIGLVCIFVEFKTPGFGIFGVVGLLLLLIFFGSKYVAGLAGQEELLFFLLGACLILVEVFLVPGLLLPGLLGFVLMIGSIFWAMVDVWPTPDFKWEMEVFRPPLWEMIQSVGLALALGFIVVRFLPHTPLWQSLILKETVGGSDGPSNSSPQNVSADQEKLLGKHGITVSELFPSGEVEIDGQRFDARSTLGKIPKGEKIEVVKSTEFDLIVRSLVS